MIFCLIIVYSNFVHQKFQGVATDIHILYSNISINLETCTDVIKMSLKGIILLNFTGTYLEQNQYIPLSSLLRKQGGAISLPGIY